jgi:hypothetical protein
MKEIDDEQAQLRLEHARPEAETALAREDIPKAAELAAVCAELRERKDELATPADRREVLELPPSG